MSNIFHFHIYIFTYPLSPSGKAWIRHWLLTERNVSKWLRFCCWCLEMNLSLIFVILEDFLISFVLFDSRRRSHRPINLDVSNKAHFILWKHFLFRGFFCCIRISHIIVCSSDRSLCPTTIGPAFLKIYEQFSHHTTKLDILCNCLKISRKLPRKYWINFGCRLVCIYIFIRT